MLVLKLDKSILFNEEQPSNIYLILVTLLVLKLDKSILVNEEQPESIYPISVTLLVLELDKLILLNPFASPSKSQNYEEDIIKLGNQNINKNNEENDFEEYIEFNILGYTPDYIFYKDEINSKFIIELECSNLPDENKIYF